VAEAPEPTTADEELNFLPPLVSVEKPVEPDRHSVGLLELDPDSANEVAVEGALLVSAEKPVIPSLLNRRPGACSSNSVASGELLLP
jgi:hypothetical protein